MILNSMFPRAKAKRRKQTDDCHLTASLLKQCSLQEDQHCCLKANVPKSTCLRHHLIFDLSSYYRPKWCIFRGLGSFFIPCQFFCKQRASDKGSLNKYISIQMSVSCSALWK